MNAAGQAGQLGNDEFGLLLPTLGQGSLKLGPVGDLLSGLDLDELSDQVAGVAVEVASDGSLLSFEAQTAPALAVGRDAIICDIGSVWHELEYKVCTNKRTFTCVQYTISTPLKSSFSCL